MSTGLSQSQVRVIDPILSTVVQGYKDGQFVGNNLFPVVPVSAAGGQVIEFGKEAFRRYNSRRSPGSGTRRVSFGYEGKPYALENHSLEGIVPREHQRDASRVPGIDLGTRAVNLAFRANARELEIQQATIATTAANYDADHKVTLAAGTKWSHADGTPAADVDTGKEAVRSSVGIEPNTLVLSAVAFKAVKNNPSVIERFKYTGRDSITTEMLASLFDLERVVVGRGVWADGDAMTDIWGNFAVLAYVSQNGASSFSPGPMATPEEPSYGYTYQMEGHPMVEQAYYDNNAKSWAYPISHERTAVLSGITAGYLIIDPN